MKSPDLISGIFWLVIGLILSLWSTRYQFGSFLQPGPGFLPLILGFLLIFLSLVLLSKVKKVSSPAKPSSPARWGKVAYTVVILLATTFVFERIGYVITFFLLMLLLMRAGGLSSWRKGLLIAFGTVVGVYLIFVLLLQQQLPRGFLGI